jgi:hypothetical protein
MKQESSLPLVQSIMDQFAALTGLSLARKSPRRYLWTDAFAVCNFLCLYLQTKDEKYRDLALALVDQVHNVLGRHRADDRRTGWISSLNEEDGRAHPTAGGLRIGKELNERRPNDPIDERLEWEQDGQYFHYLTKWMQALNLLTVATGDFTFNRWALELARTAHARFVYAPPHSGPKRMHWKMSIDLAYPLVHSMGQHDPLDGLVTYCELQATAVKNQKKTVSTDLTDQIRDMASICEGKDWRTDDPLGLGGLLTDAWRAARLAVQGQEIRPGLPAMLLKAALPGLQSYAAQNMLRLPVAYRLAFRELGLAIGFQVIDKMESLIEQNPNIFPKDYDFSPILAAIRSYVPLGEAINSFWSRPENQVVSTWTDHLDINMVMLATSLAPDGYLTFGPIKPLYKNNLVK